MDNKVHQFVFCYQLFFSFFFYCFKEKITESALVDASVQTSVKI